MRFVSVQHEGTYSVYEVPTREEYEDYQEKVNKIIGELKARITTLEDEKGTEKGTDTYKASMYSVGQGELELSGTEEQYKIFEKSREQTDKILFPRFLTRDKLVLLALDCGLSVKEIKRGTK